MKERYLQWTRSARGALVVAVVMALLGLATLFSGSSTWWFGIVFLLLAAVNGRQAFDRSRN